MSKIRESARGEQCQIRIPAWCNGDPSTVVWIHASGSAAAPSKFFHLTKAQADALFAPYVNVKTPAEWAMLAKEKLRQWDSAAR